LTPENRPSWDSPNKGPTFLEAMDSFPCANRQIGTLNTQPFMSRKAIWEIVVFTRFSSSFRFDSIRFDSIRFVSFLEKPLRFIVTDVLFRREGCNDARQSCLGLSVGRSESNLLYYQSGTLLQSTTSVEHLQPPMDPNRRRLGNRHDMARDTVELVL
jgi:hypothetical protein